ncbi:hypothetical protein [Bryobacter aggregatus]|uniref:hypothetical protein n=1 Tax=Bryobacter aggregatus TaxID=360054 RepID=UPI0004E28BA7|nr:hypothetical protein [Bryobacter aggregatus]
MSGRASQSSKAAATARAYEASSNAPKFQEHSRLILESPIFKSSRRSRDFLTYIIEKSLAGHFDELKERSIGIAVFGRPASYDTGADAIVRVTASDVRRRLHQFYAESTDESGLRIELPTGSYVPEFLETQESPAQTPTPQHRHFFWAGLLLLLCVCAIYATWHIVATRAAPAPPAIVKTLPWSVLFDATRDLRIVFADTDISFAQQALGYRLALSDYANQNYFPAKTTASPEVLKFVRSLRGVNVASVDAAIALNIAHLGKGAPLRMKTHTARSVHMLDFKTEDNFILLGSPRSNPWFNLFRNQLDFRFEHDESVGQEIIRNQKPRGNEAATYVPTAKGWATGHAYAVVAFVANSNQRGHALLIAGSNAEATEAAGKLVVNAELMAQTLKAHGIQPAAGPIEFEILLRVGTLAGSPDRFEVVACHRLGG